MWWIALQILFMFTSGVATAVGPVRSASLPLDEIIVAVPIVRGASFGELMERFGLPEAALRSLAQGSHDLSRIRPDRELQVIWRGGASAPVEVRYQIDDDDTLVLFNEGGVWASRVEPWPWVSDVTSITMEVRGSLWKTLVDAGLRPGDLARLDAIFRYVVDLNSEVHGGDRITLVADIQTSPGRQPRLGEIHAVRFEGREHSLQAVSFVHLDGQRDWYMLDGTALVRPFLRSPLEFFDVTSDFSNRRFHPVLRVSRPHTGTDLGAPYGTAVRSVADGVVVKAGYNGGHGNYVEIRHDDTWTTSYSHLSRVAVRHGQQIHQGDRLGSVGATGLATGTHLHYQMWKNGVFVDPMRVDLPLQKSLAKDEQAAFGALVGLYSPLLQAPRLSDLRDHVLAVAAAGDGGSGATRR